MDKKYILPINLSKLGFRYFRLVIETKSFSKRFIDYVTSHPNTGYVFLGNGWSGKKSVLGIGIWATSNAEMIDISSNIRSKIPEAYNVVYQSELTRLEFFTKVGGVRREMTLLDELENKVTLTALELDYIKLLSIDGSLSLDTQAKILNIKTEEVTQITHNLKDRGICYDLVENTELPANYTKLFVDTSSLSIQEIDRFAKKLAQDEKCVYLGRGNGKYNFEFEYNINDPIAFRDCYKKLLSRSKEVNFKKNLYTNLFPQSKHNNIKKIQDKFIELANQDASYFDLRNSELWYLNHEGVNAYLDISSDKKYNDHMNSGELKLLNESAKIFADSSLKYNIIDLGSGDGLKGKYLIDQIGTKKVKSYFPVDIQELELAQALRVHTNQPYSIHPTVLSFQNLSSRFPLSKKADYLNIFALLGGTYGNFNSKEINSYLNSVLEDEDDMLLISMPVSEATSDQEIIKSYLNENVETLTFSVLKQIGFKKADFKKNELDPELILQPRIEEGRLTTSFTLKNSLYIFGVKLESGTTFDITTSWKPTTKHLLEAIRSDFQINSVISNKSNCLVSCSKK